MVRKTDSPAKRMRELRYRGPKSGPSQSFAEFAAEHCRPRQVIDNDASVDFYSGLMSDRQSPTKTVLDPSPEDLWDILARSALTLDDDVGSTEIRRAFEYYNLDHRQPFHWRLLLAWFCRVEFAEKPKRKQPGAKPKWTRDALLKLKGEIKKRKLENTPATKVAALLNKDKTSAFHGRGREMLRRNIGLLRQ